MTILQEIPLQSVPNQIISTVINGHTFNIVLNSLYVNNKELQNNTPAFESANNPIADLPQGYIPTRTRQNIIPTKYIQNTKSSIYTMIDLYLSNVPIIYNVLAQNCTYINNFSSEINGYLFIYVDNWEDDDKVDYNNFGTNGTTHLYYADYDALNTTFNNYISSNKIKLLKKFMYGK
jgi:hypothetical protein